MATNRILKQFGYHVDDIMVPFNINWFEQDVVEELILKLADLKESPTKCSFKIIEIEKNNWIILQYAFSNEAAQEFIQNLNSKYPALEASEITNEAKELSIKPLSDDGSTHIFKMNLEIFRDHILPLMSQYLTIHPEAVAKYAGNTFKYGKLDRLDKIFQYRGFISEIYSSGLFGDTLWLAVLNSHFVAKEINEVVGKDLLIVDLAKMVTDYLGMTQIPNSELKLNRINIISSNINANSENPFLSDISFTYNSNSSINPQIAISRFFNNIAPNSCQIVAPPSNEEKATQTRVVTVANNVLLHPHFLNLFKAATKIKPTYITQDLLNKTKSNPANKPLEPFILTLKKACQQLKEDKKFDEKKTLSLISAINQYQAFLENEYIDGTEETLLNHINTINSELKALKKSFSIKEKIRLFRLPNCSFNIIKMTLKELQKIVKERSLQNALDSIHARALSNEPMRYDG